MKKILSTIGIVILVVITIKLISNGLKNDLRTEYDDVLDEVYLKPLPKFMGEGIILNDVKLNGKVITYYFGLIQPHPIDDLSEVEKNELKEVLKQGIISDIKKHPKRKSFVNENIEFICQFEGKDKGNILTFKILPYEYK
ncbi:hypothetical protein [Chryseobacterium sp.]|uniref:hypothetical protein n=1 Tax=Chryseobacterium sp. TaxID=1871047 RepID=UPI00289F4CA1|nr:hypothetical protein [Chryseobacterium sp.]